MVRSVRDTVLPVMSGEPEPVRPERDRALAWVLSLSLVALVSVVAPLLIARHYGALGVPRGDDWSYLRTLFRWIDEGTLDFNNWVSMSLVGQLALAAPIVLIAGRSISAVQIETALIGFAGLLAVLFTARLLVRRLSVATFVALTVAAGPPFAVLAVGYMTDIPGQALSMIAVALGVFGLRRREPSTALVIASMAVSFVAFTVRQYAAVPLVAMTLVALWTWGSRSDRAALRRVIGAAAGIAVAAIGFYFYWRTIPSSKPFTPGLPDGHAVRTTFYKSAGLIRLLGLLLAPLIVLCRPDRILKRAWAASSTLSVGLLVGATGWLSYTAYAGPRVGFAGNYVVRDGALSIGVAAGRRPDIFSATEWWLLLVAGTVGALVLILAAVPAIVEAASRLRFRDLTPADPAIAFVALSMAGYAGAYGLAAFSGLPLYDRYVLPMVPLAALLLANAHLDERAPIATLPSGVPAPHAFFAPPERIAEPLSLLRRLTGGVVLVALMALGTIYALDSASFDGTRWAVARAAVGGPVSPGSSLRWKPTDIGGSFEWINYYSARPGTGARLRGRFCVVVMVGRRAEPKPGRVVYATGWYRPPGRDPVRVSAVRVQRPCATVPTVPTAPTVPTMPAVPAAPAPTAPDAP